MPKIVVYLRTLDRRAGRVGIGARGPALGMPDRGRSASPAVASTFQDDVVGGLPLDRRPVLVDADRVVGTGRHPAGGETGSLEQRRSVRDRDRSWRSSGPARRVASAAGEGTESDDPAGVECGRLVDSFRRVRAARHPSRTGRGPRGEGGPGRAAGRHSLRGPDRPGPPGPVPEERAAMRSGRRPGRLEALGSIRRWKGKGTSLRAIAKRLDGLGVPTKSGGRLEKISTIRDLLRRTSDASVVQTRA